MFLILLLFAIVLKFAPLILFWDNFTIKLSIYQYFSISSSLRNKLSCDILRKKDSLGAIMSDNNSLSIGVDLGGTKIAVGLCSNGEILKKTVCSEISREGTLHITSIQGALGSLRDNLFVCGLSFYALEMVFHHHQIKVLFLVNLPWFFSLYFDY